MVHHTRKMAAEDPFETVSGTNGFTGAADTILILDKSSQGTTLYARGRDIEEIETALLFDKPSGTWLAQGPTAEVRAFSGALSASLRESMAQNDYAIVAGPALGFSEHSAQSGLRPQHREEVRIGKGHDERLGPATSAELHHDRRRRTWIRKHRSAYANPGSYQLIRRSASGRGMPQGRHMIHGDDRIRVSKGKRLQQRQH